MGSTKEFGVKMLRWLLVQDPDYREIRAMRLCFLMGRSIDTFRMRQIELAIEQVENTVRKQSFL